MRSEDEQRILVLVGEARLVRTFDVEHSEQPRTRKQRHRQLAPAIDKAGKRNLGFQSLSSAAALEAVACGAALKVLLGRVSDSYRRAFAGRNAHHAVTDADLRSDP